MNYVIYEQSTGRVLFSVSCPASMIESQLSAGQAFVEGTGSALDSYVDSGVLRRATTPQPSKGHVLLGSGEWVDVRSPEQAEAEQAAAARSVRDGLLRDCDWTQLPDSPLSAEVRAAWAAYRQALRDITEQPGFTASVEWPAAPTLE